MDDSMQMAKDALVLMAVSLNSSWKIPLIYFLTDSISGKEHVNLVKDCLNRLHDIGVTTVSLTCDGPSCHISMLTELVACMNRDCLPPSLQHPANPGATVHVMLNACQMLKLVSNAFAEGMVVTNNDLQEISWHFIKDLHKIQEQEDSGWQTNSRLTILNGANRK